MTKIEYICECVDKLVFKFGTRNPFEICKGLNIHIHYMDLGTALKAYYFYQSRIKNIVINTRVNKISSFVLCGHELGHAVLHCDLAAMRGFQEMELLGTLIPTEYEANIFAAQLLIPDEKIFELLKRQDISFDELAKELSVPTQLLNFKFKILNSKNKNLKLPYQIKSNFLKNDRFIKI